jgi:hypothetical protein
MGAMAAFAVQAAIAKKRYDHERGGSLAILNEARANFGPDPFETLLQAAGSVPA